jgi:hypothetical protein
MEGLFMKKQGPFIFLICLLMAIAGCHRKPMKSIVLIPHAENESPSIYAEEGGILEFRMDKGTPDNSTFSLQFSQQVCNPKDKLDGTTTQPVICHVITTSGDYDVTISETIGSTQTSPRHKVPPRAVKAYIRPCKSCGH